MKILFIAVIFLFLGGGKSFSNTPINPESLQDFFLKKLDETPFTAEALKYVQVAASNFHQLAVAGKLEEVFSVDPLAQTFIVDSNKLPENLKGLEWNGGSSEAFTRNAFGKYTLKSSKGNTSKNEFEKNSNSVVASWLSEYLLNNKPIAVEHNHVKYNSGVTNSMSKLNEYIINESFGGESVLYRQYVSKNRDKEALKKEIMGYAKDLISSYEKAMSENITKPEDERDTFIPIGDTRPLKAAINVGDWEKFVKEAYKFGWNPYLYWE